MSKQQEPFLNRMFDVVIEIVMSILEMNWLEFIKHLITSIPAVITYMLKDVLSSYLNPLNVFRRFRGFKCATPVEFNMTEWFAAGSFQMTQLVVQTGTGKKFRVRTKGIFSSTKLAHHIAGKGKIERSWFGKVKAC